GIPVLGIEPAANAAKIAEERGVPSEVAFFGRTTAVQLAERGIQADLIAANNVLAHVPDIADFVSGFPLLLKHDGVATFEFPHLLRLLESTQFDTIYHEHYSYLSLLAVERIFAEGGLRIFDVEELPTHGGSLRVYTQRQDGRHRITDRVAAIKGQERGAGLNKPQIYADFQSKITEVSKGFKAFLERAKQSGKQIAAYGAAAKGNTLLNYCDVTASDISFVADRSTIKQGKLLPGSHIPVKEPGYLQIAKPDYVLILPWNLAAEISSAYASIHAWGGQFAVAIPRMRLL
ncbi:MAG: class I SAM-dependent methyltransferase, partial [Rhodomicrobium sp.]